LWRERAAATTKKVVRRMAEKSMLKGEGRKRGKKDLTPQVWRKIEKVRDLGGGDVPWMPRGTR